VSSLVVRPAGPLAGDVQAFGAKNAVLKQMAACLLATGAHRLTNVPDITDVTVIARISIVTTTKIRPNRRRQRRETRPRQPGC